jgi:hypothetical protein
MLTRKQKTHHRYIFYRIFVVLAFMAMFIFTFYWMASFFTNAEPPKILAIGFAIVIPLFIVAIFMFMSVFVFGFEYSTLGNLERTPFPDEKPILKIDRTWGQIGLFRGTIPFFSWSVYPRGLGISILGMGKVFVPIEDIKELNMGEGPYTTVISNQIVHRCPEVNGPIYIPDNGIIEILRDAMAKQASKINSE